MRLWILSGCPFGERYRKNRDNFPLPPEVIARLGDSWLRHGSVPERMAFSGDGRFLATAGAGDRWMRVWDLDNRRPRAHLSLAAGEVPAAIALSADGNTMRALVYADEGRAMHLREFDTFRGVETRRRLLPCKPAESAAFSPDGRVLSLGREGKIHAIDTDFAAEMWSLEVASMTERLELSFDSTGGKLAVVVAGSGRIRVVHAGSGRLASELNDSSGALSMSALSGDGQRLAAWCSKSQQVRVWDLSKRQLVQNLKPSFPIEELAFAPTGDAVIGFNKTRPPVRWPIRSKEPPQMLPEVAGGILGRFSPNGSVLAVATQSGTVQLVDSRTAGSLPGSPREVFTPKPVAFAADGGRLVTGFQSWTDYSTTGNDEQLALSGRGHTNDADAAGERASVSPGSVAHRSVHGGPAREEEHGIDLLDARTGEARLNRAESAGSQADILTRQSIHLRVIAGSTNPRMGHDVRPR
jgi:WD40 repeat protein